MLFDLNNEDFKKFLRALCKGGDDALRHDSYKETCAHACEMSVHLYGEKPVELLNKVRPREDQETKQYRLEAYQATTKSTAGKALSILAKGFNPTLYSIRWEDATNDAQMLDNYALKEYPEFNSVVSFMSQSGVKKMLADPNGVFAVRPRKMVIDQTERPQPIVKVYGSPNIWYYDDESYFIFIKKQKEISEKFESWYFEYYDKQIIKEFRVNFPNKDQANIIEISTYEHNAGSVPVWHLKGVPELLDNGNIIQKSFFDDALPFWNRAVFHESDYMAALILHMHPFRTELAEECEYSQDGQRCVSGLLTNATTGNTSTCPGCHGTGRRSVKSPYGVMMYSKDKLESGGAGLKPVEYITVPVEPTKLLGEEVIRMHEAGLNALNMDVSNKVGAIQSGVAKTIDRSEQNDFMYKIFSIVFDVHLANIFTYFNIFMFKISAMSKPQDPFKPNDLNKNLPKISKPLTFDIATANELLQEIDTTKKAGMSPEYLRMLQKDVIAKKFAGNSDILQYIDTLIELDPLPDLQVADIVSLQSGGQKTFTTEDVIIHFNMGKFLSQAIEQDDKFYTKDHDSQYAVLLKFATELIAGTKTTLSLGTQSIPEEFDDVIADPNVEK